MAIKTLTTLFDFPIGTIIRDLSYDIERRLIAFGAVTYDLSGGVEASKPTLNPNLTEVERKVLLLEEMLLTNYSQVLEPFANADLVQMGIYDYNDTATATTPINVTGGAGFVYLTNDGLGDFTQTDNALPGAPNLWDASTDEFDWTDLNIGDSVDIRLDIEVTTTQPNQQVTVALEVASGDAGEYDIQFSKNTYKTAGVQDVLVMNGIYMGDVVTQGNPAKFKIRSDDNATVVVRGWYLKALARFAKFQE